MARKQNVQFREVQEFVVGQLEEAKKRIVKLEKELVSRGREQQKELEHLIDRVRSGKELKAIEKNAKQATTQLRKRVEGLQGQLFASIGIATQSDIRDLSKEVSKLSKKVELIARRSGIGEGASAHRVN